MARQPRPTAPVRGHSSSDRPTASRIGELPAHVQLYTPRTPWGEIIHQVSRHPGEWFQLTRTYGKLSAGIQLARKAADEFLAGNAAERLEFASEELEDGRVRVYLRLLPQPLIEVGVDLSERFTEGDSIFDEVEAVG